jgi:hypothetical protein
MGVYLMPNLNTLLIIGTLLGMLYLALKNIVVGVYVATKSAYSTLNEIKSELTSLKQSHEKASEILTCTLEHSGRLEDMIQHESRLVQELEKKISQLDIEILEIFHKLRMKRRNREGN